MKAVVYHGPGDLRIENVNDPVLNEGDALLKVLYSGLCGTDVKTYRRGHHMFTPPCILGHEVVGRIEAIEGNLARPDIAVGDLVAVAPYVPCYGCAHCRNDREELCNNKDGIEGAFAEWIKIPAEVVSKGTFHVPSIEGLKLACLSEPLACCVNAVQDSRVSLGDVVMIIGAGPMGQLMLELCKSVGASKVLVSEPNDFRRNKAAERQAVVLNPAGEGVDVSAWVKEQTGGVGADVVFVCVGSTDAVEVALGCVRKGGTVNLFGGLPGGSRITVDPHILHYDEVILTGSFGFTPLQFHTALTMLAGGAIDAGSIITHEFDLDQAVEAFDMASSGKALKILLKVDGDA
ncbi:MAG: alcohol dehydrogenase catalytic domain-containing protein [Firmicutes bacterium]|nr:alcohol dehydrogenase catalytic domain-containing protein [Bacillota bacterium]